MAFVEGAARRAAGLGDTGPGDARTWLFGRSDQRIHLLLTVAADRPATLVAEVQRQRELAASHGSVIWFEQGGATLLGPRRGREHFGFRDGVSQPGVEGFDRPSERRPGEVDGKPGTLLVSPGEFVLGYEGADGSGRAVPRWMWDGSFVVVRRLAQDVPGWWAQIQQNAATVAYPADRIGAQSIGRWRSGTPVVHDPEADTRSGRDHRRDNDFDYSEDPDSLRAPAYAHIRKTNPRRCPHASAAADGAWPRIIRRGIPFGLPFDPAAGRGHGVDAERGLLFVCYQASIVEQFERIQRRANDVDFPAPASGVDAVIGASGAQRRFVRTQGTVYAFTPSLSTVRALADGAELP
jgi:Dyp-type peroxidase family